ncbi:TetR/AcrR family transcriptional regulator [Caulobacter soli]|uniref:TetR/AcrR family transcriptional regulator n=1 Tax=Caulobacter soli TaxID=2708539 RepID=UPI0013ED0B9F|nr:TetR/AcrR family transcriptional regulator [Caulobacter soli]
MTTAAPRTPKRGAGTRTSLVAAGRRLLSARSADAVAIDDIVQSAQVSKGSFYTHFADKQALIGEISREIRAGLEQAVAHANADVADPARRVARGVCVHIRYAIQEPERARVLLRLQHQQASLTAPLNQGLVDDLSTGLAQGRFRGVDLEAGMASVLGVAQSALARAVERPSPNLATPLAQQICTMLLRGLGVDGAEAEQLAAQAADAIVRNDPSDRRRLSSMLPNRISS